MPPGVLSGMERLAIVVPIHSFELGGVERVGLNLARYWQDAGHDVAVVLGRNAGDDRSQAPRLRYHTLRCIVPTAAFETLWMIWSLLVYLRRHRTDVIFCPGNTYAIVCVAMRLMLGASCPPIVAKISNDLHRKDQIWPYRMAYRVWLQMQGLVFERVIGMAQPMRQEISQFMGVEDRRITIIPDPALSRDRLEQLLAIPRLPDHSAGRRFLAVGRLVPQKNLALMLRAFAKAFRPGDTLTIVGDGPEREALEALAAKFAIERQVTFTGHMPSPDALLAQADCLLLSSNYEGVPAVVIEAIAAGLPIIATECSVSMPDLLGNGERGVLVPVSDVDAMAHLIAGASPFPPATPAGRQYAASFVLEEACDRYLAVLRSALPPMPDRREQLVSALAR